jgi:hypothetical protein
MIGCEIKHCDTCNTRHIYIDNYQMGDIDNDNTLRCTVGYDYTLYRASSMLQLRRVVLFKHLRTQSNMQS